MGTTPIYGLPYQGLTDAPHGPNLGQDLAEEVETELARIDDSLDQKGYVASGARTTASGSFTTTETVVQSLSFTATAGVRYKVTALQSIQSTVTGDSMIVRLRWASGGSVTAAGTLITAVIAASYNSGLGVPVTMVETFTPGVTGTVTVGVTMVRNIGTGNISSFAAATMVNTILVEGV